MIDGYADSESAAAILQRRWLAAMRAAQRARERCQLLLEAMQFAENAWFGAGARWEELDALRDALSDDFERRKSATRIQRRGTG